MAIGSFHVKSTQKILTPTDLNEIGSYTVSVETLIHSEFQRSMLYGFKLEPDEK